MKKCLWLMIVLLFPVMVLSAGAQKEKEESQNTSSYLDEFERDSLMIDGKALTVYFIGHGTLMLEYADKIIHVDPVFREADYSSMPQGDLILVTHEHGDHLDTEAVKKVRKESSVIITNGECGKKIKDTDVLDNGDTKELSWITIEAVPAYNITEGRDRFHPEGRDNGYILTIRDFRIYIAGDTENIPEMAALEAIDVAFLPMNQPYTMTPEQTAEAAKAFKPRILYPYHFGNTDTNRLFELLAGEKDIEVRIKKL